MESEAQDVEWLNNMMQTTWPYVCKASENVVRALVEPLLDMEKPKGIDTLGFDQFSLGTVAPRFDNFQVVPADEEDELQLQMKFTWKGNPNVTFKVAGPKIYGGLSPIKIELTDIVVIGTLKVTFAHLMNEVPCVGGIQFTLTEEPTVNYGLKVKAAPGMPALSINSIPGLQTAILSLIGGALREHVVFPQSQSVVLASDSTPLTVHNIKDSLKVKPVGALRVCVKSARNLTNVDWGPIGKGLLRTHPPTGALVIGRNYCTTD